MDPDACYRRMADALREADLEAAWGAADDLIWWLGHGGFAPSQIGGRPEDALRALRTLARALDLIPEEEGDG